MNWRKRKLRDSHTVSMKRMKEDFGTGGAWKLELLIMVEEKCDVKIDLDIAGLIHEYSLGWWAACIYCEEMTDPSFSECEWRIDGIVMMVYCCRDCEEDKRNYRRKAVMEYPFSDDERS